MTSSRRSSSACTSSEPVTASAAPGIRLTSSSASYGRSSAFEGMHAQNEHSPPTSRSSTIATSSPSSASLPAATSPAGPAPITITSNVRMAPTLPWRRGPTPEGVPQARMWRVHSPWGRHGFDVVGSLGRLRVEVPEASLNPGNTISANTHNYRLAA